MLILARFVKVKFACALFTVILAATAADAARPLINLRYRVRRVAQPVVRAPITLYRSVVPTGYQQQCGPGGCRLVPVR